MSGTLSFRPTPDLSAFRHLLIYGGTFDPPHRAHVELPQQARRKLGADLLLYIPARQSPHKMGSPPTAAHHRLNMLQLALADQPQARILTDELQRDEQSAPSYTIDTLRSLRQRLPQQARLRLLIGTDQLLAFDRWHCWQEIVTLAEPAVMLRAPMTRDQVLRALPPALNPETWSPRLLELPVIDLTATRLRLALAQGSEEAPWEQALHPAVLAYIRRHGLYGTRERSS